MAIGFWFNPSPTSPSVQQGAQALTEAQWRAGLAKYFQDVDAIETKQNGFPDTDWVDTPDGQFWIGNGPGTFAPPGAGVASAAATTTSAEGDIPVTG